MQRVAAVAQELRVDAAWIPTFVFDAAHRLRDLEGIAGDDVVEHSGEEAGVEATEEPDGILVFDGAVPEGRQLVEQRNRVAHAAVTGARDQIDTLIEATDSVYRLMKPDHTGYYEVQHTSSVSVIAPDGTLRAKLQPPFDPGLTAEFLARLQIGYRKELSQ